MYHPKSTPLTANWFQAKTRLRLGAVLLVVLLIFSQVTATLSQAQAPDPRTVFVHLFEWKWTDIAQECEAFLGPKGFAAVQVSPPQEHAWFDGTADHAWWLRYQPVSYQLESRSGTRAEFIDMVNRCDAVGVDIYVDAVINHMTGVGSGVGYAGSQYYEYDYPGLYSPWDFHHCGRNGNDDIQNYGDRWEVQHCELVNLADLQTGNSYVQGQIAAYLQDLVDIGVAGFRIDASKHMPTDHIQQILSQVNGDFYVFQEVIDQGGEPITAGEYFQNGDVTEFKYSLKISEAFYSGQLDWLSNFGEAWGFMASDKAVVFVDNHDNQRGHGGGGHIITHQDGSLYDLTNIFMLAWPYGYPKIMSSYEFSHGDQGPPSDAFGYTDNIYNNGTPNCFGDWKCEHRWQGIANMVEFRNVTSADFTVSNWWSNGGNQIAFSRGDSGFVAINKESFALNTTLQTGLSAGTYCNVIDGQLSADGTSCSGSSVTVNADGTANLNLPSWTALALHVGDKVSSGSATPTPSPAGDITIHYKGWANPNIYAWVGQNTALRGAWPGSAMTAESNGWYVDTFTGQSSINLIFNAGGQQTGDLSRSTGEWWYLDGVWYASNPEGSATPTPTPAPSGGVDVTFNVNTATTFGQNVYVVGNQPELGNWDTCSAVALSPANYPVWSATVNLPANTSVAYKYIKYFNADCNNAQWLPGSDLTFTTPSSGSVTRNDVW